MNSGGAGGGGSWQAPPDDTLIVVDPVTGREKVGTFWYWYFKLITLNFSLIRVLVQIYYFCQLLVIFILLLFVRGICCYLFFIHL